MKILLIAGHGAGDPGATATIRGKLYREADETIRVVDAVAKALESYDCDVVKYDHSHNAYTDYQKGVLSSNANFGEYNYVLEIHFNACVNDTAGNGVTTGTEIYFPSVCAPSGAENALLDAVSKVGLKRRKSAAGNYAVINTAAKAGCKANLLEVCFIDDADDIAVYETNFDAICNNIASALADVFNLKRREPELTEAEVKQIARDVVLDILKGLDTTPRASLIAEWNEAKEKGITDGSRPGGYARRDEVAAMVVRATR